MSKTVKILLGVIAGIILIIFIGINVAVKPFFEHRLHDAGFPDATIGEAHFALSDTVLKDIHLDNNGDTVAEAHLSATPKDALSGHLARVAVSDAKLRWPFPLPAAGKAVGVLNLVAHTVNLTNVTVTVATPAGDIPLVLSGDIVDRDENSYRADLDVTGKADFGKLDGKLGADIDKTTRTIKADLLINNATATLASLNFKNATGRILAEVAANTPPSITGAQFDFGTLMVYGLPLQKATLRAGTNKDGANYVATAEVPNDSGDIALSFSIDRKDAQVDKVSLRAEAKLRKLDALNLDNLKGEGNLLLALTGTRAKSADLWDMTQWKDLQGSAGIDMEKLSLPGLLNDAEALASVKLSLDPANQIVTAQQVDGAMSFNGTFRPVDLLPLTLNVPANVKTPATLTWDQKTKKLKVDFDGADFTGLSVMAKQVAAHLSADLSKTPVLEGTVATDELSHMAVAQSQFFMPVSVALQVSAPADKPGVTAFTGKVQEKHNRFLARITGEQNLSINSGDLSLVLPPTALQPGVTSLAMVFPVSQKYLQDGYGIVGLSGDFAWGRKDGKWVSDSRGQLYLRDFSCSVKGIALSGLSTVMDLDSLLPLSFTKQQIFLSAINAGVPLTNGQAAISLTKDSIFSVQAATWSLFGGSISSLPFTLTLADMSTDVTLTGKDIDLGQVFAMIPSDGLEATGLVKATVPLQIRHGVISIVGGALDTQGKGVVRYNSTHLPSFLGNTQQQQLLDLKTALTHFDYDALHLTINGTLGQTQKVSLRVQGKNPLFYDGRPVDFSLNLDGPFDAAMHYAGGGGTLPGAVRDALTAFEKAHLKQ